MTILNFPDRFINSSVRHEFELRNKIFTKPEIDNESVKHLRRTASKRLKLIHNRRKK